MYRARNLPKSGFSLAARSRYGRRLELKSIAQAPLWGLGRTLALEHPEFWGGLIDVAVNADLAALASRIVVEICFPDGEDQIALSENQRLVPRLLPTQPPPPREMTVRNNASYLIVGGLGGLGPLIATWLAKSGARHLILGARRHLPERGSWGKRYPPLTSFTNKLPSSSDWKNKGSAFPLKKWMSRTADRWRHYSKRCGIYPRH